MHRVLQKAKTIHTFQNCTGSSIIMPLEKQNRRNTDDRERENKQTEKWGRREREDRLDSEEGEIRRCSRLLERYLETRRLTFTTTLGASRRSYAAKGSCVRCLGKVFCSPVSYCSLGQTRGKRPIQRGTLAEMFTETRHRPPWVDAKQKAFEKICITYMSNSLCRKDGGGAENRGRG